MNWLAIVSGLGGAAMLAFGSNMVMPIGTGAGGVFALAGVASVMMSLGLMDGE
ncbi:hypothetical protein [Methylocapsa sp. S129]|uniref:hypothetical protein n=1 Tax=Methylocapsa sp. S129 TaxID=1641869 RepID=UPI00131C4763|nr:hypothetical protein [Methylocapsa sp. S129]